MSQVAVSVEGAIGHLRLSSPEKLNAMDTAMVEELSSCCREIEHREDIHVVILSGEGKVFSAGGDIDAWSKENAVGFGRHWVRDGHTIFDAIARLRQPVIAVLGGHALGGGLELAACADYRIAETQIQIGQPETGLGIIPGWSGTQRAVRRFGAQVVRRMAIFGETYGAEQALAAGLVDKVVETGLGLQVAREIAAVVLQRGPRATELVKMMINAAEGEERERVIDALAGTVAAQSPELREGLAAFRDKRTPDFGKGDGQ